MDKTKQKKHAKESRRIFYEAYGFLIVLWLLIALAVHFSAQLSFNPILVLPFIAIAIGLKGPTKISAMSGRILLVIGIISIITSLARGTFDPFSSTILIAGGFILSGLLIEKVSPHVALMSWMYLAIATKLQAILTSVVVSTSFDGPDDIWWWLVVVLMGMSVPLLALKKKNLYRLFVVAATLLALILLIQVLFYSTAAPVIILASTATVLWPIATMRLIGYRVLIRQA